MMMIFKGLDSPTYCCRRYWPVSAGHFEVIKHDVAFPWLNRYQGGA